MACFWENLNVKFRYQGLATGNQRTLTQKEGRPSWRGSCTAKAAIVLSCKPLILFLSQQIWTQKNKQWSLGHRKQKSLDGHRTICSCITFGLKSLDGGNAAFSLSLSFSSAFHAIIPRLALRHKKQLFLGFALMPLISEPLEPGSFWGRFIYREAGT